MARSRIWAKEKVCASAQLSGVLLQTEIEAAICGCTVGGRTFEAPPPAHPAIPRETRNRPTSAFAQRALRIGVVRTIFITRMEPYTHTNVDRSSWSLHKFD